MMNVENPKARWPDGKKSAFVLTVGFVAELAILAVCLFLPFLATLLGQAPPPPLGFLLALLAAPAVLLADWIHKAARARLRRS